MLKKSDLIKVDVLSLKPTQFALGFFEIDVKIEKMKKMKPAELQKYLSEKRVPVIIGPESRLYMIDRHHLVRCCWELGIQKVNINVMSDLSHLSAEDFWEVMKKAKWCHLMDQFGNGPHPCNLLPENIRSMSNDPYRSLAWVLREEKVYIKQGNKIPFIEFYWADFLRSRVTYVHGHEGMKKMFKESMDVIRADSASIMLPGMK